MLSASLGDARRRAAAAAVKGQKYAVDPSVREERAAMLAARDASFEAEEREAEAEKLAQPDAILAVLRHATTDELAEFARRVGMMSPRTLVDMTLDLVRQRQRTGHVAQETAETVQAVKPSSSRKAA